MEHFVNHFFCFILVFEGYISKPETPNPQLPTSSEEVYCENNTLVAQGLPFPGGNIDNFWNRNRTFPRPGNILVELELPPVHEDPGLPNLQLPRSGYISIPGLPNSQLPISSEEFYFQNHTQVAQGLPFAGGITPLASFGDLYNQTVPPPLVETFPPPFPLINNGYSKGADLGLPPLCKRAKLCSKGKDQRRPYNKFNPDETNKLIEGVRRYARTYGCWIKIKNEYFKNDPHRTPDNLKTNTDLNLLPNRGPAEDLPGSSLSIDISVVILYQMMEEDVDIPTQWLTSSVPCERGIIDRDLQ
ncbi:unnamed protein product [Camellia sinensis]